MAKNSFLDCPHQNVCGYTMYCIDCGYNIYMTKEEYLNELRAACPKESALIKEIRELEAALGIGKNLPPAPTK